MSTPRRLLVAIDEMEVGGSQRQILHLLGALDRQRWSPELVYFRSESFLVGELRRIGVPVHRIAKRGAIDLRFLREYRRLLADGDYDLVHAFSFTAEVWSWLVLRTLAHSPPLVSSLRNLGLDNPRWHWRLKRQVLAGSAATIANSRAAARVAAKLAPFPEARITVIANGTPEPAPIEAGARQRIRHELGIPDQRAFGLYVGRLAKVKNLPCLANALSLLPADERPWMGLAGHGPEGALLADMRQSLQLDRDLHLLGERADATRLMQAADFLVLCSHQEGLSNVIIEAMFSGCPVVATAVGGNVELIDHGQTGLLVPSDDAEALAGAIRLLATDEPMRQRMSQAAFEVARQRHSVEGLASATQSIYDRAVGAREPSARECAA